MTKRAVVTEADMRRAVKVAEQCGLTVRAIVTTATEVRVEVGEPPERVDPAPVVVEHSDLEPLPCPE